MKLSPDDPKLTAYALGELNAAERAEVERAIADSPECQHAVEEIRELSGVLKTELAKEPCPGVAVDAAKIVAFPPVADVPVADPKIVKLPHRRFFGTAAVASIAACLIAIFGLSTLLINQPSGPATERLVKLTEPEWIGGPPVEASPSKDSGVTNAMTAESVQYALGLVTNSTHYSASTLALDPLDGTVSTIVTRSGGTQGPVTVFFDTFGSGPAKRGETGANSMVILGGTVTGSPNGAPTLNSPTPQSPQTGTVNLSVAVQNPTGGAYTYRFVDGHAEGRASNFATATLGDPVAGGDFDFSINGYIETPGGIVVKRTNGSSGPVEVGFGTTEAGRAGTTLLASDSRSGSGESGGVTNWTVVLDPDGPSPQPQFYRFIPQNNTASYPQYVENAFKASLQYPLSTFSIDVDTASYANMRRFLNRGQLPPPNAVRIEELINYFSYSYPQPKEKDPFSVNLEVAACPWKTEHRLVRVGIKGREIKPNKRPASNFVFLLDVSGSMQPADRLPLIKQAMSMLVKRMTESDRVAIVVYASEAGVKLLSTSCADKEKILAAIDALEAGGSTNGGEGIQQAYRLASENFIREGVNRVILCTDGDFNVGITDQSALVNLIQEKAKSGVYLSALGVGDDNYKDSTLQNLADKGNGNYHYIDTLEEAQKVLIEQMNGTLVTIAKDVKIQIEFNPAQVAAYRLIGYEKRILRRQDFNDDTKDAGEIGAGHTVTALYEILPATEAALTTGATGLKYQPVAQAPKPIANGSKELLTLSLRYKQPDANESKLLEFALSDSGSSYGRASTDFKFASAVAAFGMILKGSQYKGASNFDTILELAEEAKGDDAHGYRAEFINLVKKAKALSGK